MAKQYPFQEENKSTMINEDAPAYLQGITIPITLPTTGDYSVEYLKKELTAFAEKLIRRPKPQNTSSHISWRDIVISERVKTMTLGPSELSMDTRSDKELLAEALEEKYK